MRAKPALWDGARPPAPSAKAAERRPGSCCGSGGVPSPLCAPQPPNPGPWAGVKLTLAASRAGRSSGRKASRQMAPLPPSAWIYPPAKAQSTPGHGAQHPPAPPLPAPPQPRHLPDTAASVPGSRLQHPPGSSLWRAPPGAADAPAAWDRGSITEPAPPPAPQAEPKPRTQTGTLHLSSEPDPLHVSRELPPNTPNTPVRRPPQQQLTRGATA